MAKRSYASDLTAGQWRLLAPLLAPSGLGRPPQHDLRISTNAILYVLRTGCQWRMLPHDFPPWSTVYHHCRKWRDDGTWAAVMHALRQQVRGRQARAPHPSAVIIDSQAVKTTEKGGPAATMGASA